MFAAFFPDIFYSLGNSLSVLQKIADLAGYAQSVSMPGHAGFDVHVLVPARQIVTRPARLLDQAAEGTPGRHR